jgi:hypothetical protein
VSIEFYIDKGFLDHYSAFLYTNDLKQCNSLDSSINKGSKITRKVDQNWYVIYN